MQHYVITFVNDLGQIIGFLRCALPIKLTITEILLQVALKLKIFSCFSTNPVENCQILTMHLIFKFMQFN
jgi:hypothetical protein